MQILDLCDAFSIEENEYYFDHHPRTFNCILDFYRTGKLHVMEDMCVMDFCEDLEYWMIDDVYLEVLYLILKLTFNFYQFRLVVRANTASGRNSSATKSRRTQR